MTSCNDLTSAEHSALRTLQKAARGVHLIVKGSPPVKDVHLQALIETGHIEREELGHGLVTRLAQGCTCTHPAGNLGPVTRGNEEISLDPLRRQAQSEYTGGAGYGATPARVASSSSSLSSIARTFSSYRLASYFDMKSRKYSWECGLQKHEYPALRRQLNAWHRDGAVEIDIYAAIDAFFVDLDTKEVERKGSLWKLFVSKRRRSVELAAKSREATGSDRSRDSARAFQASERALLGRVRGGGGES